MLRICTMILAFVAVTACTEDETYPISGETCSEDDPVLTLDAADCSLPPATGVGTF